jgi:hypothetical protein
MYFSFCNTVYFCEELGNSFLICILKSQLVIHVPLRHCCFHVLVDRSQFFLACASYPSALYPFLWKLCSCSRTVKTLLLTSVSTEQNFVFKWDTVCICYALTYVSHSSSKYTTTNNFRNVYFQIMQFIFLLSIVCLDNSKRVSLLTIYLYFHGKKTCCWSRNQGCMAAYIWSLLWNVLFCSTFLSGPNIQKSHSAKSRLCSGCGSTSHPNLISYIILAEWERALS